MLMTSAELLDSDSKRVFFLLRVVRSIITIADFSVLFSATAAYLLLGLTAREVIPSLPRLHGTNLCVF